MNIVKKRFVKKKTKQETLIVQFRRTTIGFYLLFYLVFDSPQEYFLC